MDDNSIVVHTPSPISQEKTASSTNSLHYSTENEFDEDLYTKSSSNASSAGNDNPSPLPTKLINASECSGCSSSALSSASSNHNQNNKYTFILNAFVNGFVQLKLCANKVDFEYIIEVYWSNENKTFIKRTYDDFFKFHQCLMQAFERLFCEQSSKSKKVLTGVCCHELLTPPVLPANKKPFWTSHLKLAESREIELNEYVQRLIKLPIQISHSSIVLKFFQSQTSDPKPASIDFGLSTHSSSSIAKTSSSLINTTKNSTDSLEYDDDDDDDRDESENNSNYDSDYLPHDENIDMDHMNNSLSNGGSANEASSGEEGGANSKEEDDTNTYFFEETYTVNQSEDTNVANPAASKLTSNSFTTSSSRRKASIVIDRPEAGLWWDEDIALTNELTLSKSFSQYNLNKGNYQLTSSRLNQEIGNCKSRDNKKVEETADDHNEEEEEEDDEEMKTLEAIIKNSELFCNLANKSAKQRNKRFSLA